MYLRETTCKTKPIPLANPLNHTTTTTLSPGPNASLPSTLDLQDRLSGLSNRDILEKPTLRMELDSRGGDESP